MPADDRFGNVPWGEKILPIKITTKIFDPSLGQTRIYATAEMDGLFLRVEGSMYGDDFLFSSRRGQDRSGIDKGAELDVHAPLKLAILKYRRETLYPEETDEI